MQHTSILQVLKVDSRKGTSSKTGKPYEIETAECILYADDGSVGQVGVLDVPPDLRGKVLPGTYTGSFAMRAAYDTRRIQSVLTALTPVPPQAPAKAPVAAKA